MNELIEALQILSKYGNPEYPTCCEHDILTIVDIDPENVSADDVTKLEELGFFIDTNEGCFASYKFGSA